MSDESMVVAPVHGGRCALCQAAFRVGDPYKAVWSASGGHQASASGGHQASASGGHQASASGGAAGWPGLGINLHHGCFAQLGPGDLTRIFAALEGALRAVQSSKFKVQSSKFKVQGSRFKVQGSRFKSSTFNVDRL